jgi:hypothetical protein
VSSPRPWGTSNAFVQELVRYFALGRPGLPAQGIAAVPAQLAARARAAGAEIRLGARAERIDRDGPIVEVGVAGGEALRAGRVVVAVGAESVAELAPVPRPATNGLQTWWFAATARPRHPRCCASTDARRPPRAGREHGGRVAHRAVVCARGAPSHRGDVPAAAGGAAAGENEVRRHLAELWVPVTDWQLLRRDDIPDALPAQPAPLRAPAARHRPVYSPATTATRIDPGRWRPASALLARCSWTRGVMGAAEPLRSAGLPSRR